MEEKIYFSFFILCIILSQGTLAKSLKDVEESSKLLVRQKRVINRSQGGETPMQTGDVPYVVNLRKFKRLHCMATILSHRTAITAASCIDNDLMVYSVLSGSSYTFRGNEHNITDRKLHGHNPSRGIRVYSGVALIIVNPPFVYNGNTSSIGLHSGPVLAGMEGSVFGWGTHVDTRPVETAFPKRLRSISVPIMNHRECQNIYRGFFPIEDEDVCTYHPQKLCGDTDAGAPLVIDEQLVGVHIGGVFRPWPGCKPDIFLLVQHSNYAPWIIRNIVH